MRFDASGWNCKVAKVLPKHKGRVELITSTCIGPLEEDVLGIDSENRPYESHKWLENDAGLLAEKGCAARLICAKMEDEIDVPKDYFDYVYSSTGSAGRRICRELLTRSHRILRRTASLFSVGIIH